MNIKATILMFLAGLVAIPAILAEPSIQYETSLTTTVSAPLPAPAGTVIIQPGDFHSDLLFEKNIIHYNYIGSVKIEELYGTRNIAYYLRHENAYNSAEVIVFENEARATEYVATKLKNAADAGYKIKKTKTVYFFSRDGNKHFIWQHGNYAVVISSHNDVKPMDIMRTYIEIYPSDIDNYKK